jgi:large subunit ribosomal protein L21
MANISKAIIKLSGRDFTVEKHMILSTFSLNKEVGEEVLLPVTIAFDDENNIIEKTCTVKAIVENNFKDKKVISFKMKNRTRTRRVRNSRASCTKIKIIELTVGGK